MLKVGVPLPGNVKATSAVCTWRPAMTDWTATLWAALVAASIWAAVGTVAVGSVVTPISTSIFAAANAPASAARWVSLRAEYRVMTSMARRNNPQHAQHGQYDEDHRDAALAVPRVFGCSVANHAGPLNPRFSLLGPANHDTLSSDHHRDFAGLNALIASQ